jgi:hypothetical protein
VRVERLQGANHAHDHLGLLELGLQPLARGTLTSSLVAHAERQPKRGGSNDNAQHLDHVVPTLRSHPQGGPRLDRVGARRRPLSNILPGASALPERRTA